MEAVPIRFTSPSLLTHQRQSQAILGADSGQQQEIPR